MDYLKNENFEINNLIYKVRGKEVMLDRDLAKLYNCANGTKTINLAVNRNLERFPKRFRFQLNNEEYKKILRFQNETAKLEQGKYSKYLPYVFTEQGVAMLATIIKTEVAAQVSIRIMDAFVNMRVNLRLEKNLNYKVNNIETKIIHFDNKIIDLDSRVNLLFDRFKSKNNYLFFNGENYDAYSLIVDILDSSEKEIILIDNYIDKNVLDVVSTTNKKVKIITNEYNENDLKVYQKQYKNVTIIKNNKFHDRFIIIDRKKLYHSGASFKDLGNKFFALNKIEEKSILNNLLNFIDLNIEK